ncbi:D-alanyl-D-alanine carboxypeptidase [candidate division WOR-3 bacterium]|nr:D-alanyl-D-alanine carboxypeptidase [candidate division WOR-3 bacterium]
MPRILILALAIVAAGPGVPAGPQTQAQARTPSFDLKTALDAQVRTHGSTRWRTGIAVYSCSRNSLLYGRNANRSLRPASCQKLLVTACALENWDSSLVRTLDARLDSSNLRAHIHRVNRRFVDSLGLNARPDFPGYRHLVLANRESDNFEAEWMLHAMSRSRKIAAWKLMSRFLDERKVTRPGLRVWDACGLSHRNRVAPVTLAKLLVTVYESEWRDLFISTLAVPGRPGTLVKRNLDVGPHLAAKTGYIRGVFSLSGFLFGQTDTFAFSFIVNGCGSGTRAYGLFNSLLNTIYGWDAGEAVALPAGVSGKASLQN